MKILKTYEFTFAADGQGVNEEEALKAAMESIKVAVQDGSLELVGVEEMDLTDNDDSAQAFFIQMGNRITDQQKQLMLRCSKLSGTESIEFLGTLTRLMVEPNIDFWDGLHKVFEIKEAGVLMPELLN